MFEREFYRKGTVMYDFVNIFPEDITEIIFNFLSYNDLKPCALCNSSWRNAVNSDRIWFKLCVNRQWATKDEFNDVLSIMRKNYVQTLNTDTFRKLHPTLSPLCLWRVYYMQCVTLRTKWRNGTYTKREIPYSFSQTKDFHSTICADCDGDLLAVGDDSDRVILWNINAIPSYLIHAYHGRSEDAPLKNVYIHHKHLIIVRGKVIHVYKISDEGGKVKSCSSYHKNVDRYLGVLSPLPLTDSLTWHTRNIDQGSSWSKQNNIFLAFQDNFMVLSRYGFCRTCIFYLSTGDIFRTLDLPRSKCVVSNLKFFKYNLYIPSFGASSESEVHCCILVWNFKEDTWNQIAESEYITLNMIMDGDVMLTRDQMFRINVWDMNSGDKLPLNYTIAWDENPVLSKTKIAYIASWRIYICDILTANSMKSLGKTLLTQFGIPGYLVKGFDNLLVCSGDRKSLQIWDMNTGDFLHGVKLFPFKTSVLQWLWSDKNKIIAAPGICGFRHSIVVIDFRFTTDIFS